MKKRIVTILLIMAFIVLWMMPAGMASMTEGDPTFSYSIELKKDGAVVTDYSTLNTGDTVTATVYFTRTDIEDGGEYEAWGLQININSFGLDYVDGSGVGYSIEDEYGETTIPATSFTVYAVSGMGTIKFYYLTGNKDVVFSLDKEETVSATYTVNGERPVEVSVPEPIIYLGGQENPIHVTNGYQVTFDVNGGSYPEGTADPSGLYQKDAEITLPSAQKTGFVFMGWRDASNDEGTIYPAADVYTVTGAITLKAVWGYSVAFDANGGSLPSGVEAEQTVESGTEMILPEPVKEGAEFVGWENSAGEIVTSPYTVSGDVQLTAVWGYSVTYEYAAAPTGVPELPESLSKQVPGTEITVADAPASVTGYVFTGWEITEPAGTAVSGGKFTMPAANVTITGTWKVDANNNGIPDEDETKYTVTYVYAGAPESAPAVPAQVMDQLSGLEVTVADAPAPVSGYVFTGWEITEPAGTAVSGGKFTMPAANVTITGTWKVDANNNGIPDEDETKYTVTYVYAGAPESAPAVPAQVTDLLSGIEVTVADAPAPVTGYVFTSWEITEPAGIAISGGKFTMPAANVTITGTWKVDANNNGTPDEDETKYTVTYVYAGAPESAPALPAQVTDQLSGLKVTVADAPAAVTGYEFLGWQITSPEGIAIEEGKFTMPEADVTITGTWQAVIYTVAYNTNGGTEIGPVTSAYNSTIKLPGADASVKDGYTLVAWSNGDDRFAPGADYLVTGNVTLNAVWGGVITFDSNGGSAVDSMTVENGVTIELPETSRNGYTFNGWQDQEGNVYGAGDEYTVDGNLTLTALWTQNPTPTPPPPPPPSDTVDVSVEKVWADEGEHPTSITVRLLADGTDTGMNAELSDRNGWAYTWTDLDKRNDDGSAVAYTVEEDVPEGYVATYSGSANEGFVITNTNEEDITDDPDLPLYGDPDLQLNTEDHFAYIIGVPGGYVRPEDNITRAETATILFRLLTDESRDKYWSTSNPFSDVSAGDWYNNAISTLANAGILNGRPDGTFGPNEPITRAEYAVMFVRFFKVVQSEQDMFPDIAGHWAREYINSAALYGFINGRPDGTFGPNDYILRCEAFTLTNRVLGRKPDKDHLHEDMVIWSDNTPDKWYYAQVQEATNSHEFEMSGEDTGTPYENWVSILPTRDWTALE